MKRPLFTSDSDRSCRRYETLVEALNDAPTSQPFVTMWHDEDRVETVSWGEFRRRAEAQAVFFDSHGLRAHDTLILVMPQGISLMSAFVGAMMIGAIPAILAYPNFKLEPTKYRSGLVGVTANLKAKLIGLDEDFPQELIDCVTVAEGTRTVRVADYPPTLEGSFRRREVLPTDTAFIQHSAGTTGLQKGVALSHGAVLQQLRTLAEALKLDVDDRIYSWLPLDHDMGLIACFMLPFVYHIPLVMQSPTDWVVQPATMFELITAQRCTLAWLPNFAFQFLARRVPARNRSDYDLSCVRAFINCSEPVKAESIDEFQGAYSSCNLRPGSLHTCYAMAETVFAVTQSEVGTSDGPARLWIDKSRLRDQHRAVPVESESTGAACVVSSGRVLGGSSVRVVDPELKDLPEGQIGEIIVHSDSLFDGYYGRPDLSAEVLRGGWYCSGDLGFVWKGNLYVTGRRKDIIIVGGKNIYPQDIEAIISLHPHIHDGRVVAFGLYNPGLGTEDIVAVAELEENVGSDQLLAMEKSLRTAVVAELGVPLRTLYFKPPLWIVKSSAGKPARSATRDKLLAEHPELALAN